MSATAIAIQALLGLISGLLPEFGVSSTSFVEQAITQLTAIIPTLAQEAVDMIQPVKNVIADLSNSGAATPEQVAALQALDAQADAAFEAAAAAAGAPPDPSASPAPSA